MIKQFRIFDTKSKTTIPWEQAIEMGISLDVFMRGDLIMEMCSDLQDSDGNYLYENDSVEHKNGEIGTISLHLSGFGIDFEDYGIPLFGNQSDVKIIK